ncbi:hypothetical protein [Sorangium sp. So ce1099]|uniref:hypothetical protein n=1 Tax=Sorangium sp. So ce1099 TaxID=3133331 RepID=UPI003F5EA44A
MLDARDGSKHLGRRLPRIRVWPSVSTYARITWTNSTSGMWASTRSEPNGLGRCSAPDD